MVTKVAAELPLAVADAVPLEQPYLNGREVELVSEVLRSGRLTGGPMLARFEHAVARFVGVEHVVAVASGAAALHLAAITAGWGPGDEVVASPLSGTVTASIARATGATVTFADIDPRTLTLEVEALAGAVTEHTAGLVAVDTLGYPVDLDALAVVAHRHGLALVEDASDALGARRRGEGVGHAAGWPTIFSFGAGAQATTGDGAVLCTMDEALAAQWRALATDHGVRLGDVAAAIGVGQLEKLPRILAMRQQVADEYTRLLGDVRGLVTPVADRDGTVRAWSAYAVVLAEDAPQRGEVLARLRERGIECTPHLPGPEQHAAWLEGMYPVAEAVAARSIAIPFFPQMSPQQQHRVVGALRDVLTAG